MKKIVATIFFGMLLLHSAVAQQVQVDSAQRKPGAASQGASVKAESQPKTISVRAAARALALAAARAQAKDTAEIHVQASNNIPFNRTLRRLNTDHLPPAEDGIHDPGNEGIKMLHAPLEAYADLPRNEAGNRVDWVAALADKKITPRWDRLDDKAEGMVMDMDIVRVPRGSMPNVVFPHKQHTEWLACANCHPAIFVPQKGANQINMRLILSGEKCGVCHGKVAFPPSECRLCHSQKKDLPPDLAGAP